MALDRAFDAGTLPDLRTAVLAEAITVGMPGGRADEVMLAVHELAANVVRHGAGAGRLAMRVLEDRLYCQVSDIGQARVNGQARRVQAAAAQGWPVRRGHGLWLVAAAADHVSVAFGPAGSEVTAVFTLPGAPR